jgi:hypothetical protein
MAEIRLAAAHRLFKQTEPALNANKKNATNNPHNDC